MANAMFISSMGVKELTEYLLYDSGTEYRPIQQGYFDVGVSPNYVEDTDNIIMVATPPLKENIGENSLSTASVLPSNSYKKLKVWYYYYVSSVMYTDTLELDYSFTSNYVRVHIVYNNSDRIQLTNIYLIVGIANNTSYTEYNARTNNQYKTAFDNNRVYVTKLAAYY